MARRNFHTHSTWCDGKDTPEKMILAARAHGFDALGFSSHLSLPVIDDCVVPEEKIPAYVAEIRALGAQYAADITVFLGGEADYVSGVTAPDRARYRALGLDYLIGSVHYVVAPDGGRVPVDHTPERLFAGIRAHFGGDAVAYVKAYFQAEREMVSSCAFDIVGHLDLVRKFNGRQRYFDPKAAWYRAELEETARAVAASGKIVEVNTGAISRGWLDDAYPSPEFRDLLREGKVPFILSSDAHHAAGVACAFDRFGAAEAYVDFPNAHCAAVFNARRRP